MDGRIYTGQWLNNKQHGRGVITDHSDGVPRMGLWENGKRIQWITQEQLEAQEEIIEQQSSQEQQYVMSHEEAINQYNEVQEESEEQSPDPILRQTH